MLFIREIEKAVFEEWTIDGWWLTYFLERFIQKWLKEKSLSNYLDYLISNVLPPDDDTKTVKFLLKENLARYKLNNKGKKLKTLIIDDNQYRYNPTKPISNKLKSKLAKKRRTHE